MSILQITMIGLAGTVLSVAFKKQSTEFSLLTGLATGILIFIFLLDAFGDVLSLLKQMAETAGLSSTYLSSVLKVIGISYIAEFGAQVCADAGQTSVAAKIELAGKAMILAVAAPILLTLVETIMGLFL